MTNTETKFRNVMKRLSPRAYIKKIPDFKQMGTGAVVGLPDYMMIIDGNTEWWEVKSGFGDTITLKHFTDGQKIEFTRMFNAGCDVYIYCFTKTKGQQIINWSDIASKKKYKFT